MALASVLLMVTGLGPLGMALWNGALGFASSLGGALITNKEVTFLDLLFDTLGSFVLGSTAGFKNSTKLYKEVMTNSKYIQATIQYKTNSSIISSGSKIITRDELDLLLESTIDKVTKGRIWKNIGIFSISSFLWSPFKFMIVC